MSTYSNIAPLSNQTVNRYHDVTSLQHGQPMWQHSGWSSGQQMSDTNNATSSATTHQANSVLNSNSMVEQQQYNNMYGAYHQQ